MRVDDLHAVLDARLRRDSPAPVAVGFSGGGDSLALLLVARDWAARRGRSLLILTLDHRLQAEGRAWVEACAVTAARLGLPFRALAWEGDKPAHGLPAAARDARHRLLAEAARAAGARVILLGHTADDRLEARVMREAGATTPDPRQWAPSPAWPEGRGVFLLRPLLGLRRAEIRDWLRARDETWIDDPANADFRYGRPRARVVLAGGGDPGPMAGGAEAADLARACVGSAWGGLAISRALLRDAEAMATSRFLAAACLSAAGTARPPRGERLGRLADAVRGHEPLVATLAGGRLEADTATVRLWREPGEAARGGLVQMALPAGLPMVWDGRYEIETPRPGLVVRRLAGAAARLSPAERRALAAVPAAARGALPVIVDPADALACPALVTVEGVAVRPLARDRLLAACGAVTREPA